MVKLNKIKPKRCFYNKKNILKILLNVTNVTKTHKKYDNFKLKFLFMNDL